MKESVELPLTHTEYYEEMGINAPKEVILYGEPGTGKTLLAKAVANSTSATFLRATVSDLVQKNSGEGARLVCELFKMAKEWFMHLDEIDAVGTKRYDTLRRGEQEAKNNTIQHTMLELLNQLDGFESRGDVKVIMAINRINSLDPALIRPRRIDRKIELPKPDEKTKTSYLSNPLGGNDFGERCEAVFTECKMLALRSQRKVVTTTDLEKAVKNVLLKLQENKEEAMYIQFEN
ncbi:26S protease regulatory subunit 4 [Aphelenchoides besseyi]|nr:26S protease regulatory subunit 4 [Aphelenchoides besseyi]